MAVRAQRAAQQIIRVCEFGDGEVYIGKALSPPLWAAQSAPTLTNEVLAVINRLLPGPGGIGQQAANGYESESAIALSVLNARGGAGTAATNDTLILLQLKS